MSVQNRVIHSSQTLKTIQYPTVVNKLYIHTEKCRVESDYIKDLKYLVKA